MKVTIEMENLNDIIEEAAKINTERAVQDAIRDVAHTKVDEVLQGKLEEIVNNSIYGYVDDYLKTTKIKIGGGWEIKEVEEYTAEEYIRKKVSEIFETQVFVTKTKDRWGDWRETKVTFQQYLDDKLDAEAVVKPYIDKIAKQIKDDVNLKVKSVFDEAMRNALAENVFQIVSSSDTYRTISQNMKLLGE